MPPTPSPAVARADNAGGGVVCDDDGVADNGVANGAVAANGMADVAETDVAAAPGTTAWALVSPASATGLRRFIASGSGIPSIRNNGRMMFPYCGELASRAAISG